jgi:O-antigen biosynthesis protein
VSLAQAVSSAAEVPFAGGARSCFGVCKVRALTAFLHLVQPAARLCGRLSNGLAPWRLLAVCGLAFPGPRKFSFWTPCWRSSDTRLQSIVAWLSAKGARLRQGGEYDRWDLEVRGGILGAARLLMAVEDTGGGQLVRMRFWPRCSIAGVVLLALFSGLCADAIVYQAWAAAAALGTVAALLAGRMSLDCAAALAFLRTVEQEAGKGEE